MDDSDVMSRSREAWSEFGDEFADIGRQFRENYEALSAAAERGTDKSRKSIERSVRAIRKAVAEMGNSLAETLRDDRVRNESEEAGAALLNAFGVTLSEIGTSLQREAEVSSEADGRSGTA